MNTGFKSTPGPMDVPGSVRGSGGGSWGVISEGIRLRNLLMWGYDGTITGKL